MDTTPAFDPNRPYPIQLAQRARHALNNARRGLVLARALSRLRGLAPGQVPVQRDLRKLRWGFGNGFWSADESYLEELARLIAQTRGSILECGSGVTTLLVAAMLTGTKRRHLALEHLPEWNRRVARLLRRHDLQGSDLRLVSLVDHGDFDWYLKPVLQQDAGFDLVICDGPPGATRGGRYGLLDVMAEHLNDGCLILLDDAHREEERAVVERWMTRFRLTEQRRTDRFAVLQFHASQAPNSGVPATSTAKDRNGTARV